MKKIGVLGAGISGLALAWELRKRHPQAEITILEKSARCGGWIETSEVDGFLFERGPRSCRTRGSGVATLQLVEELGLQNRVIFADPKARYRYIYDGSSLIALPTGPLSLFTSSLSRKALTGLLKEWNAPPREENDESIYNFIKRRLGKHVAEWLIDPLTQGIYAGNCRELSMKACFPSVYQLETEYGSLTKGLLFKKKTKPKQVSSFITHAQKFSLFSLKGGMEELIEVLSERLKDHLKLETSVKKINFLTDGVEVRDDKGNSYQFDHLYSTLPANALSSLFSEHDFELEQLLQSINFASVSVVSLGYNRDVLPRKGFGYLVPSCVGGPIMGTVFDSAVFPEQNTHPQITRLTMMLNVNEDVLQTACDGLERHLGIKASPAAISMRLASEAIPQYNPGHLEKVESIMQKAKKLSPHLTLLGTSFHGVSVNDCIQKAIHSAPA